MDGWDTNLLLVARLGLFSGAKLAVSVREWRSSNLFLSAPRMTKMRWVTPLGYIYQGCQSSKKRLENNAFLGWFLVLWQEDGENHSEGDDYDCAHVLLQYHLLSLSVLVVDVATITTTTTTMMMTTITTARWNLAEVVCFKAPTWRIQPLHLFEDSYSAIRLGMPVIRHVQTISQLPAKEDTRKNI